MARPQKCRCICSKPEITEFIPKGSSGEKCVNLTYDEYETVRLLDPCMFDSGTVCKKNGHFKTYSDTDL